MDITNNNKAFMIRNDGTVFAVTQHIYGNTDIDQIEETIYAAEWLFEHTKQENNKKLVFELLHSWIEVIHPIYNEDYLEAFYSVIDNRPYKFLSKSFVTKYINEIQCAKTVRLTEINRLICEELNQEFLRARFNGMYNSSFSDSGEMVFRISSANFNWFNIIWSFVYTNKTKIKTVSVVADEEATGKLDYYYNDKGIVYNNLPIEDFITLPGNSMLDMYNIKQTIVKMFSSTNYSYIIKQYIKYRNKYLNTSFRRSE